MLISHVSNAKVIKAEGEDETAGTEETTEVTEEPAKEEDDGDDVYDVSDDDGEYAIDYADNDGVKGVVLEGKAAKNAAFAKGLLEEEGLEEEEADEIIDGLFGTREGEDDEVEPYPRSGDGTFIENISVTWITPDSWDDGDDSLLSVRPGGDSKQSVRLRVVWALSGENDYEPGDITITIPAKIFKNRSGNYIGKTNLPYPENPLSGNDFNWNLVDGNYVLTNTKKMQSSTMGYFEISFTDLTPHELQDMKESDAFQAFIIVNTHLGNTLGLHSSKIRARFDMKAEITSITKRPYEAVHFVDASEIPEEQRIEGVTKYLKVDWYVYGNINANTLYTFTVDDWVDGEYDGFIIGATSEDGLSTYKTYPSTYKNGTTSYITFSTAYPAAQFEPGEEYYFHNNARITVTEVDPDITDPETGAVIDERLVTWKETPATKYWKYQFPQWSVPQGHFMIYKNGNDGKESNLTRHQEAPTRTRNDRFLDSYGWYGIYPNALNKLQANQSVDFSYTMETVAFIMPWTFDPVDPGTDEIPAARILSNYFRKPVTITSRENEFSINRADAPDGHVLTIHEDYELISVEFLEPHVYTGVPHNINPDGSWAAEYAQDGTFLYEIDLDKEVWPDIDLEVQVNGSQEWVKYATASWKSGDLVITLADENHTVIDGAIVDLPEGTDDFRTVCTFTNAAIIYDVRAVIRLKPSTYILSQVDQEFENTATPMMYFFNSMDFVAVDSEGEEICRLPGDDLDHADGYVRANGYTTESAVVPAKMASVRDADIDYNNRKVTIHYTAKVEIRSVINDKATWQQAIDDGRLVSEHHAIWRDLLPKGVTPVIDTIQVRNNDSIVDVYTIENYKGSGRTLLVVEADLTPTPTAYRSGDMVYYEDVPFLKFDATYSFDNLNDYGGHIHNVVSYQSDNEQFGTIEDYIGEPDDPYSDNNVVTGNPTTFANNSEKDWMTDLDNDGNPADEGNSFVYAGVWYNIDILSAARTSLHKEVMVNNDGYYSQGVWWPEDDPDDYLREVYTGGNYTYRLRMMSDAFTRSKNLVIFDSLENFVPVEGNSPVDVGEAQWQGTLKSVDMSQLIEKGCAPVLYYSTVENLQLTDESNPQAAHPTNTNLDALDEEGHRIWQEASTYTDSLADVKAIAIDCSMGSDGEPFTLEPLDSVVVLVNMKAPGEMMKGFAYNNAVLVGQSEDINTHVTEPNFVRDDYTKVGLTEYFIEVEKEWDDDDDRDGIRPFEIVARLYANGEDTKEYVTLNEWNEWSSGFYHLPYADEDGWIHYTIVEDPITGYTPSYEYESENHIIINNRHDPEKTNFEGVKTWVGDDPEERPSTIVVRLYGNGHRVKEMTITADSTGYWSFNFTDIYKYENGEEIDYWVEEVVTTNQGNSYIIDHYDNGHEIVNTYHPYGDLEVYKEINNATWVSEQQEFTFTFVFTKTVNGEEEPVNNEYDYEIYQWGNVIDNGTISTNGTISIKGSQWIRIYEIDEYVHYTVTEDDNPGWTLTYTEDTTGTIIPNNTVSAYFRNKYAADGLFQPEALKTLENKELKRYQFVFDVYDTTDGGRVLIKRVSNETPHVVEYDDPVEQTTVDYSQAHVYFGSIRYTEADAGRKFFYEIEEKIYENDGYIYDETVYQVEVTVTDNGDGTLSVVPVYYKNGVIVPEDDLINGALPFTNEYHAEGDITLYAWKELNGRPLKDNEFTFWLFKEVDGHLEFAEQKTNDEYGQIAFTTLEFDEKDNGKTFYYAVAEYPHNDPTVIFDDNFYGYKLKVEDYGNGTLNIIETLVGLDLTNAYMDDNNNIIGYAWVEDADELPVFKNSLYPGSLSITKLIDPASDEYDETTEFHFHVKLIGEDVEDGTYHYEISQYAGDPGNGTGGGKAAGQEALPVEEELAEEVSEEVMEDQNSGSGLQQLAAVSRSLGSSKSLLTDNILKDGDDETGDTTPQINTSNQFHVDDNDPMMDGYAYAFFDSEEKALIFFRYPENTTYLYNLDVTLDGKQYHINVAWGYIETSTYGTPKWEQRMGEIESVRIAAGYAIKPKSTSNWFRYADNLTDVDLSRMDTSQVTSMAGMFTRCQNNLTTLDLTTFDTSNVTNMSGMFSNCRKLTSLDLSSFNTSKVTSMADMFWTCENLQTVNVSSFDTSEVMYMNNMFSGCSKLESIDLSNFRTPSLKTMNLMFTSCSTLKHIDLSTFDISNVTGLSNLFSQCTSLESVKLDGLDTSNVTSMANMFNLCTSLTDPDIGEFNTENVKTFESMFSNCDSLTSLDLSNFNTTSLTNCSQMFANCDVLKTLNISQFDTRNAATMGRMFENDIVLDTLTIGENFRFKPMSNINYAALLPTPTGDEYSGKWVLQGDEFGATALTPADMRDQNIVTPGTWVWQLKSTQYTIVFKADEGVGGTMGPVRAAAAEDFTLPANKFRKFGYEFDYWHVENVRQTYQDQDTISGGTYENDQVVTLRAVFKEVPTDVEVHNGEFDITLLGGQTATFTDNIPAGTAYQIWEETPDGWVLVSEVNSSGVIESCGLSAAIFTNRYQPDVTGVTLHGSKMLDNTAPQAGAYSFSLYDSEGELIETVSNNDGGLIVFSPLTYTQTGTYTYTIKEVIPENPDDTIDYDQHTETVTVTVSQKEDGTLVNTVTYDDEAGISFLNKKVPGILKISKIGQDMTEQSEDDEFTFKITFTNAGGMPIGDGQQIYWYLESDNPTSKSAKLVSAVANNTEAIAPVFEDEADSTAAAVQRAATLTLNDKSAMVNDKNATLSNSDAKVNREADPHYDEYGRFHATADMLTGTAYAIAVPSETENSSELIFFRSTKTYSNKTDYTNVNINENLPEGRYVSGTVYTGFENAGVYWNTQSAPWWQRLIYGKVIKTVSVAEGWAIKPKATAFWFYNGQSIRSFDFSQFDTSIVTSMRAMFLNCRAAETIDISYFDTSNVTAMNQMFGSCYALKNINFGDGIDTSKVTTFASMFSYSSQIETIDVSKFDVGTANTIDMSEMFSGCSSLKTLDLSSWGQSNVTTLQGFLSNCTKLESINLTGFVTPKLTNTSSMFRHCDSLTSVDISDLVTDNVTTMAYMFYYCNHMASLDVSTLNTQNVTTMESMFSYSTALTTLDLSSFVTPALTNMSNMFYYCTGLENITFGKNFNTTNVTTMKQMFYQCWSMKELDLSMFETPSLTDMSSMCYNNAALETLDISKFTTSSSVSMSGIFTGDTKLSKIVLGENFTFNGAILVSPGDSYIPPATGKWIRVEGGYESGLTRTELSQNYIGAMAGTWVWQYRDGVSRIVYNGNGSNNTIQSVVIYNSDTSYPVTLPDGTRVRRNGYVLTEWNKEKDGSGASFVPGQTYTYGEIDGTFPKILTLFAQWALGEYREYYVYYYQQNAELTDYVPAGNQKVIVNAIGSEEEMETLVITDTAPLKEFEGFITPEAKQVQVYHGNTTDPDPVEYYYDRETYTIAFDGNGADYGHMNGLTMVPGYAKNLPANSFQKVGAIFLSWNTEADGSGTTYVEGQSVNFNAQVDETVTLYAQWTDNDNPTVTPTNGVVYVTCKPGETIVIPNLPEGTTYTIEEVNIPAGWTLEASAGITGNIISNQTVSSSFTNKYSAEGQAQIIAYKQMIGVEMEVGQFSFELLENGNVLQTKENFAVDNNPYLLDEFGETAYGDDGEPIPNPLYGYALIEFDPIEYGTDDFGTHTYIIREESGNDYTIEYDNSNYQVTVSVTDEGGGEIGTTVTYPDDTIPVFINSLKPGNLQIDKYVGKGSPDGQFTFIVHLYDAEGNELTDRFPLSGGYAEDYKSGEELVIDARSSVTILDIPDGTTYTVEESDDHAQWLLEEWGNEEGTIHAGETSYAWFFNTYEEIPYCDLVIEKILSSYGIAYEIEEPVTFVFEVTAVLDGETVYHEFHSMTVDSYGVHRITIEDLPSYATVTVEEVYAGAGYEISGSATAEIVLNPDLTENKVIFENTFSNGGIHGYGAQNTYSQDEEELWIWTSDLEEGGEDDDDEE
ncbi:MAG: BspA family leucine-rich repeat surface protein [Erysipelotrichaceae bacterium]|nr:BspA family leucine-rich repeat surface protein [Erysipelotrichaceae bacterium]